MTLAGWKRPTGTEPPPTSTVAVPPVPNELVKAALSQSALEPAADAFSYAEVEPEVVEVEPLKLGKNTIAAAQDLERALAELDGPGAALLRGTVPSVEPAPAVPEAVAATESGPIPFGAASAGPTPFGAAVSAPAPAFGAATQQFVPSAPAPTQLQAPAGSDGSLHFGFNAPVQQPAHEYGAPAFVPPVFNLAPTASFAPGLQVAPGTQFAPGVGAVPPVYSKAPSSTGKTVGIVVAIVFGLIAILAVLLIGAVTLLGNKVESTFNTISGTLPNYSVDPYATDPYDTDPQAADPYANAARTAAAYESLTPFELGNYMDTIPFLGRNTDGPMAWAPGEGCVVFQPDTMSYGAFACSGNRMNAQLVTSGITSEVNERCLTVASERAGAPVDVTSLWMVDYANGQAECFIRNGSWSILRSAGLSMDPVTGGVAPAP